MVGRTGARCMRKCHVCGYTTNIHSHHVFGGPNRQNSEKYNMKIDLCGKHHNQSNAGIHFNPTLDQTVKRAKQREFEEIHGHEMFMKVFGRNYL